MLMLMIFLILQVRAPSKEHPELCQVQRGRERESDPGAQGGD